MVVSAHRTPDRLMKFAKEATPRGIRVVAAAAGGPGAAHLPGMAAVPRKESLFYMNIEAEKGWTPSCRGCRRLCARTMREMQSNCNSSLVLTFVFNCSITVMSSGLVIWSCDTHILYEKLQPPLYVFMHRWTRQPAKWSVRCPNSEIVCVNI